MSYHTRKYAVDEDFFAQLDTIEKAYWLGFLAADGCVHTGRKGNPEKVVVTLQAQDLGQLEALRDVLHSTYEIRPTKRQKGFKLQIASVKLCRDLVAQGVPPCKSLTLRFPQLPDALLPHFIRGYFDGDGCFYIDKRYNQAEVQFEGNPTFLWAMESVLRKACKLKKRNKLHGKATAQSKALRYGGNRQVSRIVDFLGTEHYYGMARKHQAIMTHFAGGS